MINELNLNKEHEIYQNYDGGDESKICLSQLSQINLFIGQNNSGKSRLLRAIFNDLLNKEYYDPDDSYNRYQGLFDRNKKINFSIVPKEILLNSLTHILKQIENLVKNDSLSKWVLEYIKTKDDLLDSYLLEEMYIDISRYLTNSIDTSYKKYANEIKKENSEHSKQKKQIEELCTALLDIIKKELPLSILKHTKITYIPSFRSLRKYMTIKDNKTLYNGYEKASLLRIEQEIIKTTLMLDYFIDKTPKKDNFGSKETSLIRTIDPKNIFTGESLYDIVKKLRNSPLSARKTLIEFEKFLSDIYFNGELLELHALEVNEIKDVFVRIGENKEFPIFNLGDGIQSIIILTFPLFLYKERAHIVFIEEPELFLHPGMQRIFLETLASFPNTQAFIATHSNHFLELSLENPDLISIYSLQKKEDKEYNTFSINQYSSPSTSLLSNLGVRNSSVFLSNSTIWVEGISDRIYISKYLHIYMRENPDNNSNLKIFKEDFHYSFIEFSGNNISHWNFIEEKDSSYEKINATKISNKIFLIHDKDENKEIRHENLKEQLKDNYYPLPCIEIENLLTPEIIKKTISMSYIKTKDLEIAYGEFKQDDYIDIPFGEFIPKIIEENKIKKFISKDNKTTTRKIQNKLEFAKNATKNIICWSDISPEAQKLTKAIYQFISRNN